MQEGLRDQYLSALGVTQWVLRTPQSPVASWRNIGGQGQGYAFAFVIDTDLTLSDLEHPDVILLRKMITAIGQAPEATPVYACACATPDGLPLVIAQHVIVLGHASMQTEDLPAAYYFAPSLSVLHDAADAKRALWLAMKQMMGSHG